MALAVKVKNQRQKRRRQVNENRNEYDIQNEKIMCDANVSGTVKSNRKNMPKELVNMKLRKGEMATKLS